MTRRVTIAAGCATLLASAPLATLFRTYSWLFYAAAAVTVVAATALAARTFRAPLWAQLCGMLGTLAILLTWLFGSGASFLGIVPTPAVLGSFTTLLEQAGRDVQRLAAPVPDTDGLLFTTTVSVGLVAVLVDLLAVSLRQPALAGLPMLAIYSVPVAVMSENVSWLPFAVGAAGFLWLLMADHIERVRRWGRRFADNGRDVDAWESSPLAAAGRRLGLAGVAAAVLIPLALPGMTAGVPDELFFLGSGLGGGPGSADGRSVNPIAALQGDLNRRENIPMLRVRTDDPSPGYLRLAVADRITERGATPSRPERSRGISDLPPSPGPEPHTARVRVLNLRQGYLPAYLHTTAVTAPNPDRWSYDDSTSVIWARSRTEPGMEYRLFYRTYDYTAAQLRESPDVRDNHPVRDRHTDVPENPTVQALVDTLTAKKRTQYDSVRAIHDYFSRENGFRYATTVEGGTSGSAVVDFLKNKRGYCQQYAVAMTWMLRAADIPARVAIGFTQGGKSAGGFTIRSWNAHAWVEVYFSGYGWVPFDPTPASGAYDEVELPWAPNPYTPPEDVPDSTASPTTSVSPGPTSSRAEGRDPGDDAFAGGGSTQDTPVQWPYWLTGYAAALGVLLIPALRRIWLRAGRLRVTGREGAAAAYRAWDELLDTLADLRIDYLRSDTPRAVARRLTHARPPLVESTVAEVDLLVRSVERAEYSRRPLTGDGLAEACRAVCLELRKNALGRARAVATLFPPSVLRRWRGRVGDAIERGVTAAQGWRGTARHRLPGRQRVNG